LLVSGFMQIIKGLDK